MIDINDYVTDYYMALRGILRTLPKGANIPAFFSDTSFIIGYNDVKGKIALQLFSKEKAPEIILGGKLLTPISLEKPGIICFRNIPNIERIIFPQDTTGTSVSITSRGRNTVLKGFAFSTKEYNDKYWKDAKFYRNCGGEIPFTVTSEGTLLGLNLLWGSILGGKREEKLFEYIKMFGSRDLFPTHKGDMLDEVFRDFGHAASGLGEELDNWSFTSFISKLEKPLEQNVLLLGSYKSDAEFEKLRRMLGELGYRGFLLKDSPDLPIQSNLEKLLSAIICSCFIIVLDKNASGHIAELGNMLQFRFRPVIVIRDVPTPTTAFLEDQIVTDKNFKVVVEPNLTTAKLIPHIQWAKEINKEKTEDYNAINHWRGNS